MATCCEEVGKIVLLPLAITYVTLDTFSRVFRCQIFLTDSERPFSQHHESHVMSCHVMKSLPTDLVRSRDTLLYHVVLVRLHRRYPVQ